MVVTSFFALKSLRDLCIARPQYLKVQSANNNPNVSRSMRFTQLATGPNLRGARKTVVGLDRIPLELRPPTPVILPLTNFPIN
jgi:hypothetical protein